LGRGPKDEIFAASLERKTAGRTLLVCEDDDFFLGLASKSLKHREADSVKAATANRAYRAIQILYAGLGRRNEHLFDNLAPEDNLGLPEYRADGVRSPTAAREERETGHEQKCSEAKDRAHEQGDEFVSPFGCLVTVDPSDLAKM